MKKPTILEIIGAVLFVAAMLGTGFYFDSRVNECVARGGLLVRAVSGYECIAAVRK